MSEKSKAIKTDNMANNQSCWIDSFLQAVHNLANKLPQWSSDNVDRRLAAAQASLLEECGELCGLVSKYQTRNTKDSFDLWETDFDQLPDELKSTIRDKFIDESGDFLWVLEATFYTTAYLHVGVSDVYGQLCNHDNSYDLFSLFSDYCDDFRCEDGKIKDIGKLGITILSEIISSLINIFLAYDDNCRDIYNDKLVSDVADFLWYLKLMYNISIDDILLHNLEKLGIRYDDSGKRVDGKL